jgi:hypothetical protein
MAEPSTDPAPTGGSRPGTRKVRLPWATAVRPTAADDGATRPGRPGGSDRPSPTRAPRPWWRRRRFWQAVIAVEVVAALAISVAFGDEPDAGTVPVLESTTVPAR